MAAAYPVIPRSRAARKKVGRVLREFRRGDLYSHGRRVRDPRQALAIALSEARHPARRRNPPGGGGAHWLAYAAFAAAGWYVFLRRPAGGGPTLWESLTAPAPAALPPGGIPSAITTSAGSIISGIGARVADWIGSLGT